MKTVIYIHAKCNAFEIFEYVDEDKAVSRLKTIKKLFNSLGKFTHTRTGGLFTSKNVYHRDGGDRLIVTTTVVNPEINFTRYIPESVSAA